MDKIKNTKRIHLIGIGGINVSAIAKLLQAGGFVVSGSDVTASDITRELEEGGIKVSIGQKAENITDDISLVVYTDAIPEDNVERQTAAEKNIRSISAFQFWGEYSKDKKVVAVSGTNGKSTTTAMLGLIMEQAGMDPTVVVGTKVLQWNSNIRIGQSDWLVIEADEYHAHMLELNPQLAVLTNITPDHLDYYKDLDDIVGHFQTWIDRVPSFGGIVVNADDQATQKLKLPNSLTRKYSVPRAPLRLEEGSGEVGIRSAGLTVRSGHDSWAGYVAYNIVDDNEDWGKVEMRVPGLFNVSNALAASGAADILGIKHKHIIKALDNFRGTWRRFELVGEYNGALVVSDYAHHPDGIKATLEAARGWYPFKKIVLLYQPHQHNRTRKLFDDFAKSFAKCDELILAEIYDVAGRSSAEDKAVSSKDLAKAIKNHPPAPSLVKEGEAGTVPPPVPRRGLGGGLTPDRVSYAPDLESAEAMVKEKVSKGDVLIVMGAGDVDKVVRNLIK